MKKPKRTRRRLAGRAGRIRRFMQICADLIDNIPGSDDNLLQTGVKVVSIAEVILSHVEGEESAIEAFVAKLGLERRRSRQLVNLFFQTPLAGIFETGRIGISETTEIIKATHPEVGALYFVERAHRGSRAEYDDEFYFEPQVDFEKLLGQLWDHFDGRINVRLGISPGGSDVAYTTFPVSTDKIYGTAEKRLDDFVRKHRLYQIDDVSRTYLAVGQPGTGKSTQMLRAALKIGSRILRLDAESLARFQVEEVGFLLGSLKPDTLIVDDVDKSGIKGDSYSSSRGKQPATLLSVLEWMKIDHPEVVLLLTANDEDELPGPMRRPGRIDETLWFDVPNKRERRAILKGYVDALVPKEKHPPARILEKMVTKSEGLAGAWLKEIALQLRYQKPQDALKSVQSMRRLGIARKSRRAVRRLPTLASKKKRAARLQGQADRAARSVATAQAKEEAKAPAQAASRKNGGG